MTLIDGPKAPAVEAEARPYVAPRLELTACPRILTTFDGFAISGRVFGSEVDGVEVEVTVAGVARTAVVANGSWVVRFEDGALHHHLAGVRPVTGRVTDRWFNTAQATEWVTIDEFVEGFVHVDYRTEVVGKLGDGHLVATGELALGTHDEGRELTVELLDDNETVVSTAFVEPGWHHGEWRARLPLGSVTTGMHRVRAILTDKASRHLTRQSQGQPFLLS